MNEKIRIYTKTVRQWKHTEIRMGREVEVTTQEELAYKEYDLEGNLIGCGTEDFSMERYRNEIGLYSVYSWDGVRRNKGNKRWFDYCKSVTILRRQKKQVEEYYKNFYKAELVQLRRIL